MSCKTVHISAVICLFNKTLGEISTSVCLNNISSFVSKVTLLKMQLCYAILQYLIPCLRCIKTLHVAYYFRLKIYKGRSYLGDVSVECRRRSPRCDFTQWSIYFNIYFTVSLALYTFPRLWWRNSLMEPHDDMSVHQWRASGLTCKARKVYKFGVMIYRRVF